MLTKAQLSSTTNSTSETTVATSKAVKAADDLANTVAVPNYSAGVAMSVANGETRTALSDGIVIMSFLFNLDPAFQSVKVTVNNAIVISVL